MLAPIGDYVGAGEEELRRVLTQQPKDGLLCLLPELVVVGDVESLNDEVLNSVHSGFI